MDGVIEQRIEDLIQVATSCGYWEGQRKDGSTQHLEALERRGWLTKLVWQAIDHRIAEAVAAERKACATLEPEPLRIGGTDAEPEYGTYDEVFLLGWEAYRSAIRARGDRE